MKQILDQFNFRKTARTLGVSVWQTPNFLFLVMGVIIATTMIVLFFVAKDYSDPKFLLLSECFVAVIMLAVGSSIIDRMQTMAQVNHLKTRFIELASSRLKDPLATIRWELEILLDKTEGELNEQQKKRLNSIIESNENMINLVKDLLDTTRLEDPAVFRHRQPLLVDQLVRTALHGQKEYARARTITLDYQNQEPEALIEGRSRLLKIALENLISNAIRFSPKNQTVEITVEAQKSAVTIAIKDHGYGIPKDEQQHLFTKFFRASNILSYNIEGTGLGLYVAQKIVQGFSGSLWFESKEGEGSQFFLRLPRVAKK